MRRSLAILVAPVVAALVVAVPTGAQSSKVKAFAPGCWKGKGQGNIIGLSSPAPGITVNISKSSYTFKLAVLKTQAVGFLDFVGHGTGSSTVGGVTTDVELDMKGDLDLTGTPSKVVINGDVAIKGVAIVGGASVPLDLSGPVSNVPLTITTAAPTKVAGTAGKSKWTAVRVAKKPCI
jgi:hypothetical protein